MVETGVWMAANYNNKLLICLIGFAFGIRTVW